MRVMKIMIITLLVLAVGCSGSGSKKEVLEQLVSDSGDRYKIHLFYEDMTNLDSQLLVFWNSKEELLKLIQGIQLYDVSIKKNKDTADALGLSQFPCMVVTNDKEVVLETKELSEIEKLFQPLIP